MDSRKIVEVLRATLDANQQAPANEQLQQVGFNTKNWWKMQIKANTWNGTKIALKSQWKMTINKLD